MKYIYLLTLYFSITFNIYAQDKLLINTINNYCEFISKAVTSKKVNDDIDVYKDISPHLYLHEGRDVFRLAIINVTRNFDSNKLLKAHISYQGQHELILSEYCYKNNSVLKIKRTSRINNKQKITSLYFHNNKLVSLLKNNLLIELSSNLAKEQELIGLNDSTFIVNMR